MPSGDICVALGVDPAVGEVVLESLTVEVVEPATVGVGADPVVFVIVSPAFWKISA